MKILHLNLTKKWFNMILSGEKPEEYRDVTDYWRARFLTKNGEWKKYDIIRFSNGYSKNRRQMDFPFITPEFGTGMEEWGAVPGKTYFVLTVLKMISTKNV